MAELKPCPFCGGKAGINIFPYGVYVQCLEWGCGAEVKDELDCCVWDTVEQARENHLSKAIEKWNRRAGA